MQRRKGQALVFSTEELNCAVDEKLDNKMKGYLFSNDGWLEMITWSGSLDSSVLFSDMETRKRA
jgi:hypothetical protein